MTAALVWFKRDLRVRDHAPLAAARHFECALALVVIEPQWLASAECDPRHVGFLLDCVAGLQHAAHLLARQTGPRSGSAGPVHPALGTGDRYRSLPGPDRR